MKKVQECESSHPATRRRRQQVVMWSKYNIMDMDLSLSLAFQAFKTNKHQNRWQDVVHFVPASLGCTAPVLQTRRNKA